MSGPHPPVLLLAAVAAHKLPSPLALERHLRLCQVRSVRLFEWRCRAEAMRGLFLGRPITTLALALLAAALAVVMM